MSPLRWDVLLAGFVLALPVLALGLRGDLTTEEVMIRVLWCLGAGLGGGRAAALRQHPPDRPASQKPDRPAGADPTADAQHSPV